MANPSKSEYDIVVVGAGFFGLNIAEYFGSKGKSVLICEAESSIMKRASYVNQARIHNGYHYPRSVVTAKRSHDLFGRFVKDFTDCVYKDFNKYYGIGKITGKVNAKQYKEYCARMCEYCEEAPSHITNMFNSHYIEKIFSTIEYAFDALALAKLMEDRLDSINAKANKTIVELCVDCKVNNFIKDGENFKVLVNDNEVVAKHIFNCTYSNINMLNNSSNIDLIPLKYEMTEMALIDVPDELYNNAFTIMCGPFFSVMPFPANGNLESGKLTYSLSHVRYTPHFEWTDSNNPQYISPLDVCKNSKRKSQYINMIKDASRYLPIISDSKYVKSIWEVKTVLPASERSDSRPILFKMNYGVPGYHCIMGGKLDNIYDVISTIENNPIVFGDILK